jgi:hypothetical protein
MYTLVALTPPPVRLFLTGGGEYNWRKSGRCIVRDNNPPPQSRGRVTPDDWDEGVRNWTDRLFLESSTISSDIVDTGMNQRKKKPYTPKSKTKKKTKIFGEFS